MQARILDIADLIKSLKTSELIVQCPKCDKEFKLSASLLFDGTKKFPETAEKIRLQLVQAFAERKKDLIDRSSEIACNISPRLGVVSANLSNKYPAKDDVSLKRMNCDSIMFSGVHVNREFISFRI